LNRIVMLSGGAIRLIELDGRLFECPFGIAGMRILVALVDIRCHDGLGAGGVEPGRWLFGIVFDSDLIGGFARILESLGDDQGDDFTLMVDAVDRKSTRLNSSHSQ